ncbi:MAG: O-antigen ligase family protein [Acidimicrobiia bacterium]
MIALPQGETRRTRPADPFIGVTHRDRRDLLGFLVVLTLAVYLVVNRLIPDVFVLPVGLSIRPWEPVLGLLALLWLLWLIVEPKPLPLGALGLIALSLLVVLVLAYFWNAPGYTEFEMRASRRGLVRVFLYSGLFISSYHVATNLRWSRRVLILISVLTAIQGTIAIFEFVLKQRAVFLYNIWTAIGLIEDPDGVRGFSEDLKARLTGLTKVESTAPHPITLSALLAMGVLLTLVLYLHAPTRRQKRLFAALLVPQVLALPVTNSRTGFFILILAGLGIGLLQVRKWPSALHLGLAVTGLMGIAFMISSRTARLLLDSLTQPGQDPNIVVRLTRAEMVPDLMSERPLIGPGYITTDVSQVLFDNAYYKGLLELGVLGFLLLLSFFLVCLARSIGGLSRADSAEQPVVLMGALGVLCLLFGGATFDAWTFDQFFPTGLILLGIGVGRADMVLRNQMPRLSHQARRVRGGIESVAK